MSQIPALGGLLCLLLLPAITTLPLPHLLYTGEVSCLCALSTGTSPHPTCIPYFISTQSPHPGDGFLVSGTIFFHLFHEYSVKCLKHWINTYWMKGTFEFKRWGESKDLKLSVSLLKPGTKLLLSVTDRSRAHYVLLLYKKMQPMKKVTP